MTSKADETFQDSLQGLANWLTYLEMKQSMYSQQLARARKQSPGTENVQTGGNGAAAQSVFSDMAALKAPSASTAAQVASDGIPPDGLGDSWLTVGDDTPATDDPLVTAWREDDPEMAAWDLDDDSDDPIGDAWAIASEVMAGVNAPEDANPLPNIAVDDDAAAPELAIPAQDEETDDDLESDETPPSWL